MSATALLKPTAASGQSAGTLACPSHVQDHPGGATPAMHYKASWSLGAGGGPRQTDRAYMGNMYFRVYPFHS